MTKDKPLNYIQGCDTVFLRHKLNDGIPQGNVFLLFGKNALSILSFPMVCKSLCRNKRSCVFFGV